MGCCSLHQGIFPTQETNPGLLRCRQILYHLCLQCRRPWFSFWVGKIRWRRDSLPTPVCLGFPGGSAGKESACKAGGLGLIPGLGRFLREGNGYPLQYSGLESSMDYIDHGVAKSWTQPSDFYLHFNDERVGALFEDSQAPQSKFHFNTALIAPKSHASF